MIKNRVNFSDIFFYAEQKFNIDWNRANNMFFDHSLDYKSYNEYELGQILEIINDLPFEELSEDNKGYFIISEYMKEKNLDYIFISNK